MKKSILLVIVSVLIGGLGGFLIFHNTEKPLPKQEKSEGLRGTYDIDKNINEKQLITI